MDPYYYEFNQELVVSNPNIESTPSKASRRHQITLNFSCKHKHNRWIRTQDSTELQLLEDRESPAGTKSMQYHVPRIDNRHKFILRAAVFKGLEDFPLSFLERQDLSLFALNTAWKILVETSQNHHHHHHHHHRLDFDVTVVHDLTIDESLYVEWMSQEAATEAAMVPATEASVKSLLDRTIECSKGDIHGSCPVCLEDFEDGGGRVATMPCSHMFHGECIEKWLKRSHRCPVCRYEMPAESRERVPY